MIYTKTGDSGSTSLVGGARVSKDDVRVEAYGTVDELNAHIGLLAAYLKGVLDADSDDLRIIQHKLFCVQTLLATEDAVLRETFPQVAAEDVSWLERHIDCINGTLPPLKSFVLPGGSVSAAQCHVARCVCRRAERRIVTLYNQDSLLKTTSGIREGSCESMIVQYMNRLSDYLFVLSRKLALAQGEECCVSVC